MTLDELERVKDFTISNEFGTIHFIDETDLTDVDLAEAVTIEKGQVEVYNKDKMGNRYPAEGTKLNKEAVITLNNINPDKPTYEKKVAVFKAVALKQDVSQLLC